MDFFAHGRYNAAMENAEQKRIQLRDLAPARLIVTLLALLTVAAVYARKGDGEAMARLCAAVTRPFHDFMSQLCAHVPFSVAELVWAGAVGFVAVYIIYTIVGLIRSSHRLRRVYTSLLTLTMAASLFWAGFMVLWTPCYYAPTFSQRSGVEAAPVSAEDLAAVTRYFAREANKAAAHVQRDERDIFTADREDILDRAAGVYGGVEELWPFLTSAPLRPKGIVCSKVMSLLDFTGFFFPMTGEANVNMDSPAVMLPATAEHEISHQRGVASEQECNFLAVTACMSSQDADFRYSGALLAYIYLGNALYSADQAAWQSAYSLLSPRVRADLADNSAYWQPYRDTVVKKASNTVYGSFLVDNGQELGLKSYGACVDLLVSYYQDMA